MFHWLTDYFIACRYGAVDESLLFRGFSREKHLDQESISFVVPALGDVECTLEWEDGNFIDGAYVLHVGEKTFKELPKFDEKVDAPPIAHTIMEDIYHGNHIERLDWLVFLSG